jgi:hypothetical protein
MLRASFFLRFGLCFTFQFRFVSFAFALQGYGVFARLVVSAGVIAA